MSEIKVCSNCGSKNPASNNFCEQCGSKLTTPEPQDKVQKPVPAVKNQKNSPAPEPTSKERSASPSPAAKGPFSFSWMQIAYAVLILITIFTRFDHLGAKPHHHDESMHSFYSWQLFHDGDYEYNPMMHGPFQFHGNAFMYYLFGVSNATSRYLAAFFGLLTVVLAMFLSPFIGRWGAFLATTLIVFSPSFMYFDRFTREDAYIAGATFMMVVFLFRYLRSRAPVDLWLASVGFTVAFCTKESMFLTIAVMGTYLFIRLLPWADIFIAGGITALGILTQIIIPKTESNANFRTGIFLFILICAFAYTVFQLIMRWNVNRKQKQAESNLWDAICGLGIERVQWDLLALITWWLIILVGFEPKLLNLTNTFFTVLLLLSYFIIVGRFCWLWLKNVSPAFTGSIAISSIIFTLLFTTFFTVGAGMGDIGSRLHGLMYSIFNGAYGGLMYWWDQHDVHRGDEPWYYYILQLPANEMVSYLFSLVAMVYYGIFKNKIMPIFLSYWYVGSLALFSWAGEKMPWLILHPLLPSLLLTAYFMGQIIETIPTSQAKKFVRMAALVVFGILLSYSLHSAVGLSFYHEADPVEPLVYVQSGPDVKDVEKVIREISYGETGGTDLHLTIEDKCSWPFAWSLRDFPYRNHPSTIMKVDNPDPIVLTATESDGPPSNTYAVMSQAGYVERKYKLRVWWVPSWFKKGYPGTDMNAGLFFDWFGHMINPFQGPRPDMADWNDLKKWVLYREVWSDMGSYNMRMWVRPDLAQKYGFTHTDRTDISTPGYPPPQPTPAPTPKKNKHNH